MTFQVLVGDVLERLRDLPDESVQCVVTSPPYWGLRDYGTGVWDGGDVECDHLRPAAHGYDPFATSTLGPNRDGISENNSAHTDSVKRQQYQRRCEKCGATRIDRQIGLEATPAEFLAKMVAVFREVRRVLRSDGTCWVNMGDAYAGSWGNQGRKSERGAQRPINGEMMQVVDDGRYPEGTKTGSLERTPGLKPKDLIGMPWRLAFALQEDGWWLRQDIIWSKPNPMPESVTDRCTKAHEYIFLLSKSAHYFYDAEAIKEAAVADHPAGNTSHKGTTAYEAGDEHHRTKQGLVAYAVRNSFARITKSSAGEHGQKPQHREGREDVRYGGTRNKRSVWEIATEAFPEAHFATFPTKLVEPCILAGTSERGCCSSCGAPWERVVEKPELPPSDVYTATSNPGDEMVGRTSRRGGNGQAYQNWKNANPDKTVGWMAGCGCGAEMVPCTVLDPFSGAGTTGVVAGRLGRDYIGIELNPEYATMSERRITDDNPMFNVKKVAGEPVPALCS